MADQPDFKDGVMIALYPSANDTARYALIDGTPADEMHVTMVYLGHIDEVDPDAVKRAVGSLSPRPAFTANVSGHARFTGDEQDVIVALIDAPEIEQLRRDLVDVLAAEDISSASSHGYTPHMTLTYINPDDRAPFHRLDTDPIGFDTVWVVYGEERTAFPLGDDTAESIRPYARTAYAQGWAASGGPMTDQVRAGCIAAMDLCVEHAHDPDVLEVALHLGHLEGVWAQVFARREDLFKSHIGAVQKAWRAAVDGVDVAGAVRIFRQQVGLGEALDRDALRRMKDAARNAAVRLLQWIPGKAAWQGLRDAMRAVVTAGRAEGYASSLAVAASQHHMIGFNFDIAFQHAYDALENLGDAWAAADPWLERMLGRAADEFGRTLGDLAASGADYSQMVAAGLDVLQDTVADKDIVGFIVDWAASTGMSRGALDLYASEGVTHVSWLTAGDGRVCPVCERNGEESPFLITDFPTMPAHPLCRCVASAEFNISPNYGGFFG